MKKSREYWVQPVEYHAGFCPSVRETMEEAETALRFWEAHTDFEWEIIVR